MKALAAGLVLLTQGATPPQAPAQEGPAPALTVPGLALDLASLGADERLALALHELGRGRAREGLARLEALVRDAPSDAVRERAERELRRARAWIELRDAFLRQRVASGRPLEFTHEGTPLASRILAFEGGELRLENGRAPERCSVEALDPLELARQIEPSGGAADWARIYPFVLRGDPRAGERLEDDGGEAGALVSDLRTDYPARLRLAALLGRLDDLARRAPPGTREAVRANLDDLAAWRRDAEGLALLAEKRLAVQSHARALLARELEFIDPRTLLRGKLETLPDEVVRLTYEFVDPHELEDFTSDPYPQSARRILGEEQSSDVPFRVESGTLVAHGAASLRSLIDLAAPLSVRYTFQFQETPMPTPNRNFALGICDDGREHFLLAVNAQHLERYDRQGSDRARFESVLPVTNRPYAMELRHDGTEATLTSDGKLQRSLAVGSRRSGAFFLCMVSDCLVRIERVQIEGRLPLTAFERVKRAWIEHEMERF